MLSIMLMLATTACASPDSVVLARDGEALADIVVSRSATKAARFGAEDLKWHLGRMTGADFRIITDAKPPERFEIRVGRTNRSDAKETFENQQFKVKIAKDFIELVGRDARDYGKFRYCPCEVHGLEGENWPGLYEEQGSMYAVYDFLETLCGVRWCDDSDFGTYVPQKPELALACGEWRKEPFVRSRTSSWGGALNMCLWKPGTEGRKKWHAKGWRRPEQHARMSQLYLLRHRAGGVYRSANHSLYGFIDLYWDTNSPKNVAYRPEWFANGRDQSRPSQLCYSNPEVIKQVVKMVRDYFNNPDPKAKRWGADQFCLEPMDNSIFCTCDRCRPQFEPARAEQCSQHSTYWFRFVNTVAKEIAKSHPKKYIVTLAYMSHEGLPTDLELEKNVRVYNCIFDNRMPTMPNYEPALKRMQAWHARYPGNELGMWLYNTFPLERTDRANYKCFPGFYAHEGERQYRIYKECNARWCTYQCGLNGPSETYMQLEWMIDPDKTADELIDGYFSMFGAAKPAMKRFYALVEKRHCDPTNRPKDMAPDSQRACWEYMGDKATMDELGRCIAEAERLADTRQAKGALELFKLDVWNYMQEGVADYAKVAAAPEPSFDAPRVASAGGDPNRVDWTKAAEWKLPFYFAGVDTVSDIPLGFRLAHDGEHLYVEASLGLATSNLTSAAEIYWCDDIELMIARERQKPYRCWFMAPDGRMVSGSFGEIDNGWMTSAAKSGAPVDFGAKYVTAKEPDRWICRWSFPLKTMAVKPVAVGETFRMNLAATLSPKFAPKASRIQVFTLVPYTYLHVVDRMAAIRLR